jgi:LysM repeat protein
MGSLAQPVRQSAIPALPKTYKVQFGDSLELIAQRYNLKLEDLRTWNGLGANSSLYVDQVIKLEP